MSGGIDRADAKVAQSCSGAKQVTIVAASAMGMSRAAIARTWHRRPSISFTWSLSISSTPRRWRPSCRDGAPAQRCKSATAHSVCAKISGVAVLGAGAGCIVGHHEAAKNAKAQQPQQGSSSGTGQANSNSGH
jgi:hypothetical protein